jgi:hypothetical protein
MGYHPSRAALNMQIVGTQRKASRKLEPRYLGCYGELIEGLGRQRVAAIL